MSRPPVAPPSPLPSAPDAPEPPAPTRRAFLKLGSLAAAAAAAPAASATAQPPRRPAAAPPRAGQPKRLRGRQLPKRFAGVSQADQPSWIVEPTDSWFTFPVRLARRITLGVTTDDTRQAIELGYFGYLDRQLEYDKIDDRQAEDFVAAKYPLLAQGVTQTYNADINVVIQQLQDATLYRAAFSRRQLYQRMVEFWSDHFTIYARKVGYLKLIDDREVIRKHALGKFPELLKASAHSAAMLVYLDQQVSRRGAPNQNYARELMELHTLGVDGGYTQQDVAEVARALTGWTIQGRGDFAFNPSLHDYEAKTVLGRTLPRQAANSAAGIQDGEAVLDMLVAHPSTARFVSRKMLRFLLWYEPSDEMVEAVAGVYASTGGDIRSMVRACLDPSYLAQAPAKLKRPFHFLVSALRGLEPSVTTVTALSRQLVSLGQQLFMWETPDGYPDHLEYWAGNLLPRWNVATTLSSYANPAEINVDVAPLVRMNSADAVVYEISRRFFGGELNERTRQELVAYLKAAPTNTTRIRETLALALSSSEFQWY